MTNQRKKIYWVVMWWNYIPWLLMYDKIKEISIMVPSLDLWEAPRIAFFVPRGVRLAKGASRCSTPCSNLNFN
jgi:hypothetical protein